MMDATEYDAVERQIAAALDAVPGLVLNATNSAWTKAVKQQLAELGTKLGWRICTSGFPETHDNEWLYDMVWFRNNADGQLEDVGLVLESEWDLNFRGVKFDFEKLLLSKSKYKVMVFQGDSDTIPKTFNKLAGIVKGCSLTKEGEKYLFCAWDNTAKKFIVCNYYPG
jgi:hypothetical protein